jgi:AraC-like DNA-binding protein
MTPGSLLLGNEGRCFSCGHEHGEGDRCLAFFFEPAWLERIAADAGVRRASFATHRLPFLRLTAPLIAYAAASRDEPGALEESAVALAGTVFRAQQHSRAPAPAARDERRVAEIVRLMETTLDRPHALIALAQRAGLSPYHFLRVFRKVTGVTPHQLLLRLRLNAAARRLRATGEPVTEVAYAVGFEDLSNFVRSFRTEFGVTPSRYRASNRCSAFLKNT